MRIPTASPRSWLAPLSLVAVVGLAGAVVLGGGPGSGVLPVSSPTNGPPGASGPPIGGGPIAPPTPAATPQLGAIAIVPVTSFRSPWETTDAVEVRAVLDGTSTRYAAIEVVGPSPAAVLQALGAVGPLDSPHLVLAATAEALRSDMAAHRDRLGFLPPSYVDPSVRALAWNGVSLFGVDRVASLADWPLTVPGLAASGAYDPSSAWTLVAAGDINLDGLVAHRVKQEGKGVDYPFDGGAARITGHTCCSFAGNPLPVAKRSDDAGSVRALFGAADLALANFENPAPDAFTYHLGGYTFTADPALIEGVRDAGFDWLSLANNHILNAGGAGLVQTIRHLDAWGIAHSGAGANLADARRPALLHAGGVTIAVLGYDTIRPDYAAGATTPGTNEMTKARVRADIASARAAGADVVIVFPHWGIEYTARTTARQRALAHAAIDAGADLVIGSHPHWAGAVEIYKGVPIFYCLGDFVFSIDRSEQTLEGIVPELTFVGTRLVQVRIHPYLILDLAQPNWLDPAGSGRVVMRQVFGASDRLPW